MYVLNATTEERILLNNCKIKYLQKNQESKTVTDGFIINELCKAYMQENGKTTNT